MRDGLDQLDEEPPPLPRWAAEALDGVVLAALVFGGVALGACLVLGVKWPVG